MQFYFIAKSQSRNLRISIQALCEKTKEKKKQIFYCGHVKISVSEKSMSTRVRAH